jgi:hypothetical protein
MSDENTPLPASGSVPEPESPPPAAPARVRRSGVWWGAALVLVGLVLLVSQFAPRIQLWRFWPLIIIAFGVRAMFAPGEGRWTIRHLFEGLSTITFGLIFLGQMVGYLGWDVWLNILRLWPLLIISLGLELVGKGLKSEWVRALGSIVVIGGLAYGALAMTPTTGWPLTFAGVGESEPFSLSAAEEPAVTEGAARIEGGVGVLTVQAGSSLVTADGRSPFEPVFDVDVSGRAADARIGLGEHVWGPLESDTQLDVTLSDDVVWDLDIAAGVTRYDLDLRDLPVSRLQLEAGVSDGTLTLGDSDDADIDGPVSVEIEAGVSALTIRVPEGDRVYVEMNTGLSGMTVRGDWDRVDGEDRTIYESDRFSEDGAYWDISIEAGIGGITIEYY